MVVPVAPIDKLHTENKGIPLGVFWQSVADRIKSSDFNERMETTRKDMGPKLTEALVQQLALRGYEAQAILGAPGSSAESAIDESKLPSTDASCVSTSTKSACPPPVSQETTCRG